MGLKDFDKVTIEDDSYPKLLREIPDPPRYLYVKGNISLLGNPSISVVGTRRASRYGKEVARDLSYRLSDLGLTVVSGLARGVDTWAHIGALDGKGKTVAVLGSGIDVIYPKENRKLYERICEEGLIISPFEPGEKPYKWNFPKRNRVIAGISFGTVVVECPMKSGAMITARLALDYGREVFAVPGNITSTLSEGPNYLIRNGAKPVIDIEDIISELPLNFPKRRDKKEIEEREVKVLELIKKGIDSEEDIIKELDIDFPELSEILLSLEIKGFIRVSYGKIHLLGG